MVLLLLPRGRVDGFAGLHSSCGLHRSASSSNRLEKSAKLRLPPASGRSLLVVAQFLPLRLHTTLRMSSGCVEMPLLLPSLVTGLFQRHPPNLRRLSNDTDQCGNNRAAKAAEGFRCQELNPSNGSVRSYGVQLLLYYSLCLSLSEVAP